MQGREQLLTLTLEPKWLRNDDDHDDDDDDEDDDDDDDDDDDCCFMLFCFSAQFRSPRRR